jgi:uncharacterized protein YihD (DUF1040 family)
MRDPDRITIILEAIRYIWNKHPDMRLMQLILNCLYPQSNGYHIEENELIKNIITFYGLEDDHYLQNIVSWTEKTK